MRRTSILTVLLAVVTASTLPNTAFAKSVVPRERPTPHVERDARERPEPPREQIRRMLRMLGLSDDLVGPRP
jgi:hypothetical protein